MNTQGDVLLFQTNDDGEINITDGITQLTGGFDTSLYLALFGGNFEDDGSEGNPKTWWGNLLENEPERKYISRTQNLLRGLPASSLNLRRVEEAARADLQWYLDTGIATEVVVEATIPAYGEIEISGSITVDGIAIPFKFTENWKSAQIEAAESVEIIPAAPIPTWPPWWEELHGTPDTSFASPGGSSLGLTFDGANLVSCNGTGLGGTFYIHNGITAAVLSSFSAPGGVTPQGLTFDGTNLISCGVDGKIRIHDGITSSVLSTFNFPGSFAPAGLTFDGTNLISCDSSDIYVHDGITSSVLSTFPQTDLSRGLAFDGFNLISCGTALDEVHVYSGLSAVETDSFSTPGTNPFGLTFDGINLISCDVTTGLIYVHPGVAAYAGP